MTAVWMFFAAELRRRWRSWLALAVLAGLAGGLVTAVAAGARRTDAAYPALVAFSQSPDDLIDTGPGQAATFADLSAATLARLPQVIASAPMTTFTALSPASIMLSCPQNSAVPARFWHRKLLAGRLPAPAQPDQVDISFTVAQAQHLKVGGTLRVLLLGPTGRPVPFRFHVAGIDAAPGEFPPQYGTGIDFVWGTPAFFRQYGHELLPTPAIVLRLRHGAADVPAVDREIAQLDGGKAYNDYPLGGQAANTEHSIHLQAVALWLLAGLLALLGSLVAGQLLARQGFLESASYGPLRAIGMSRRQLAAAGLIRAALIGAAGGVLAVILAVAASPLFPMGLAGIAEPHPGVHADWPVFGLGLAGVLLAVLACGTWPAWRAAVAVHRPAIVSPRGRPASSIIASPITFVPAATGIRLALRRGAGRTALPVPTTIAAAALGVTALSASMVFTGSFGHLLDTPRLYGVTWNAIVVNLANEPIGRPAVRAVTDDPQVAQWSGTYLSVPVEIRGVQVGAITNGPGPDGSLAAVPMQGQLPARAGDIVLGQRTLAAIHARIGQTVEVSVVGLRDRQPRTIVGTAVFPSLGDTTELGTGAVLTVSGLHGLVPRALPFPRFTGLMVKFRPGSSLQPAIAALAARMDRLGPLAVSDPPTPADLVNFGQVQALPLLLGLSLGALALLTIVHLLLTSARRRRDLAVLRCLGFTRRQVREAVAWQAVTLVGVALVIGIPAGIVGGRVAWLVFTAQLGILPVLDIPGPWFAALVAAALALAVAVAAVPGESAARAHPTDVLRAE